MSDEIDIWLENFSLQSNEKEVIIRETLRQVQKDFALQGESLDLEKFSTSILIASFASILKELDFIHSPKFAALLYQLDLKEAEISLKLRSSSPEATYNVLSESILKRCFEKVMWRRKFRSKK